MSMNYDKEMERAREVLSDTLYNLGLSKLMNRIELKWNGRFTRKLGDALFYDSLKGKIRLSKILWERATEEERFEVIVHETCHIVDSYMHWKKGTLGSKKSHGESWKRLMRMCGVEPKRCHTIDRTGIRRKIKREIACCDCREEISITSNRATRMRNGYSYVCTICNSRIRLKK